MRLGLLLVSCSLEGRLYEGISSNFVMSMQHSVLNPGRPRVIAQLCSSLPVMPWGGSYNSPSVCYIFHGVVRFR